MALDLVNIARTGIARSGIARLNAGEVEYSVDGTPAILSGSAYVQVTAYNYNPSGGLSLSGNANQSAEFTPTVSDGVAIVQSSADFSLSFTGTASGSLDFTGTDDATPEYLADASGSADLSGTSVPLPEYILDPSGGLVLAGDSSDALIGFNTEAGGTIHLDGTPGIYADYKNVDAFQGGVTVEGVAVSIFTIDRKGLPVFIRRFDGDVRLALNQDGGFLRIRGGQPEMDEGLETAVNISLFSSGDYWGNALAADGEEIGSGFVEALRAPLSNQARLDVIESACSALSWLVSVGIASAVEVSATIPSAGRLDLGIIIRQPEKAPAAFRYTVNWQSQKIVMQEAA